VHFKSLIIIFVPDYYKIIKLTNSGKTQTFEEGMGNKLEEKTKEIVYELENASRKSFNQFKYD